MAQFIKDLLNHERYQTITFICVALILIGIASCESTAPSIINPTVRINREQLQNEANVILAKIESAELTIEKQDKLKELLFNQAIIASQGQPINPIGLITSLGTILGIGAITDNVRKRKVIKKLETPN